MSTSPIATVFRVSPNIMISPFTVVEMEYWDWLTLKRIIEVLDENNENPYSDHPLQVHEVIVNYDYRVWVFGLDVNVVIRMIELHAFNVIEEKKEDESDFLRRMMFYLANPDNRVLYDQRHYARFVFSDVCLKRKHETESLPINFKQLSALNAYTGRQDNPIIELLGMSDGALMFRSHGMTIGIEPDGYCHS